MGQLEKYKQKFLEGISHNLKTPLHGIMLYVDSMKQRQVTYKSGSETEKEDIENI